MENIKERYTITTERKLGIFNLSRYFTRGTMLYTISKDITIKLIIHKTLLKNQIIAINKNKTVIIFRDKFH